MKKLGIMTFYDIQNYGAALQAYALQKAIEKYDVVPEFVRYYEQSIDEHTNKNGIKQYVKVLKNCNYNVYNFLKAYPSASNVKTKFEDFREKYFKTSQQVFYGKNQLINADSIYDAFVCGSDMIWSDIGQDLDVYYLKFASPNKRIAYAPSLTGIDFENDRQIEYIRKSINGIRFLSCREKYGVDAIKKITGQDAFHAVDPTLLLTKDEWISNFEIDNTTQEKYILCYMFQGVPKNILKQLKKIAKERSLTIRYIPMGTNEFVLEQKAGNSASYGPREFVELFSKATFIVTNSYHGLLFSLIFEKPFVLLHRDSSNVWGIHEERMSSILALLGLENRFIKLNDLITSEYLTLDYSNLMRQSINNERIKSIEYLKNALNTVLNDEQPNRVNIHKIKTKRVDFLTDSQCTGCSACVSLCQSSCISLHANKEGFLYPIIDEKRCTNCGLCARRCPVINDLKTNYPKNTYIGFGKGSIVDKSASGGVFATIATEIINKYQGVVFGAILEEDSFTCKHVFTEIVEGLVPMQNSKYVQSEINDSYRTCKSFLDNGRIVLFSGTPCQIAGLKKYLSGEYKNLYTMDIICHGVPSPKFFGRWINEIKKEHGDNIMELLFRHKNDKKNRRSAFETKITYKTKVIYEASNNSPYYKLFISEDSYRECCYRCKYAQENRVSDITIGDCDSWHKYLDFYLQDVKSSILINSTQGEKLWNLTKENFMYQKLDYEKECQINHQLRRPPVRKSIRNNLYEDLNLLDWKSIKRKYGSKEISILKKIFIRLMKIMS